MSWISIPAFIITNGIEILKLSCCRFLNLFFVEFQAEKEAMDKSPYLCLSDFVAPKSSGKKDYIGMFAVTAGHGVDKMCKM